MSDLKYTYALDSTKTFLVHINDARQGEEYFCPNSKCDERLIIKDGGYKRKHFSHTSGKKCSYDNYLHSLAERKFAEWFNSSNEIFLQYYVKDLCQNYDKCIWRNDPFQDYTCIAHNEKVSSLTHFYDNIELEKHYGGFIWDLWITNSKNSDIPPIAIEIYVTHKCEDKKLQSGVRIIEIKIESEEQLDEYVNSNIIKQNKNLVLHNFQTKSHYIETQGKRLYKFWLFDNLKAYSDNDNTTCKSYLQRRNSSLLELTYQNLDYKYEAGLNPYSFGCAISYKKFPNFKSCFLCNRYKYNEYHERYICIAYKQITFDDMHNPSNAMNCKKFSLNEKLIKESVTRLSEITYNVWMKSDDIRGRNFKNNTLL